MKLFIMEGRYIEIFGVHFVLFNNFRGTYRINIPFFLSQSINVCTRKNRRSMLVHQGIIKIIVYFDHLGERRARPLYQQVPVTPLLEPTPIESSGSGSHNSPPPFKESISHSIVVVSSDSEDSISDEGKNKVGFGERIKLVDYSNSDEDDDEEI